MALARNERVRVKGTFQSRFRYASRYVPVEKCANNSGLMRSTEVSDARTRKHGRRVINQHRQSNQALKRVVNNNRQKNTWQHRAFLSSALFGDAVSLSTFGRNNA